MLKPYSEAATLKQEREARELLCPNLQNRIVTVANVLEFTRSIQLGHAAVVFLLTLKANFRSHIFSKIDTAPAICEVIKEHMASFVELFKRFLTALNEGGFLRGTPVRAAEFLRKLIGHSDPICKIVLDFSSLYELNNSQFSEIIHCVFGNHVCYKSHYDLQELETDIDSFFSIMCARIIEFIMDCEYHECDQSRKQYGLKLLEDFIDCANKCLDAGYLKHLESIGCKVILEDQHKAFTFNICSCEAVYGSVGHEPLI